MSSHTSAGDRRFRAGATIGLTALAATVVVPVLWILVASLKSKREFYGNPWSMPHGLQWHNFTHAFVTAGMGNYFLNSILVTALGLVLCMAICVPASYAIARFDFRGKAVVEALLTAGLFINVSYIVVPIFLMLLGWDNQLRSLMPNGFFINNLFVLALVYAATSIPFTCYLLIAYLRTIPDIYEEAAMLDGSSRLRTMTSVILPMAMPAVSTAMLFDFLSFWNDYIISETLIPGRHKTLQVGLLNLFQAQRAQADYGRLYAGMVIVVVPVIVFYALIQKRLLNAIGGGGVKL